MFNFLGFLKRFNKTAKNFSHTLFCAIYEFLAYFIAYLLLVHFVEKRITRVKFIHLKNLYPFFYDCKIRVLLFNTTIIFPIFFSSQSLTIF